MHKYNILVISDSHGNSRGIENSIKMQNTAIDALIHLGDGCNDLQYCKIPQSCAVYTVRGNCDFMITNDMICPFEQTISFGEFKFLIMHGHKYSVKESYVRACIYAANLCADVLLFGHTHTPYEEYYPQGSEIGNITLSKPLYVFNPGSVGKYPYSFGNIQIIDNSILFGISK